MDKFQSGNCSRLDFQPLEEMFLDATISNTIKKAKYDEILDIEQQFNLIIKIYDNETITLFNFMAPTLARLTVNEFMKLMELLGLYRQLHNKSEGNRLIN